MYDIDPIMYPLKYGSGNWGLMELLIRGCVVVAADRCYVPEMIEHGHNGMLVQGDSPQSWSAAVIALMQDGPQRLALGENAKSAAEAYYLPTVAESYMALFNQVIEDYRARHT